MLEQMTQRLQSQRRFEAAVETLLNDVVALHGAEYGDLQLLAGDELVIVAQRGLTPAFLHTFRRVQRTDGSACGRALRLGRTVVVTDVTQDPEFTAFRGDAAAAGFRSVQSTPIVARNGTVLGIVSTHFANVHTPTPIEIETLGHYCVIAAGHLLRLLGTDDLAAKAEEMSEALYAEAFAGGRPAGAPDVPPSGQSENRESL
jgi:GAF domain-containing protein